jgi:hypothetical protein
MPENERYLQDKLPIYGKRRISSQFASVFVDEKRIETNRQMKQLRDTKTVEVKKIIPKKNILYCDDKRNVAIIKLTEQTDEKITTFVLSPDLVMNENDKRNRNDSYWWPNYLVANRWLEEPNIKFSPWNLNDLNVVGERRFGINKLNEATIDEIGGKAYGLVHLKKYEKFGFKIPDFIVIPTSFYKKLDVFGFSGRAEEIMKRFASPEDIMRQDSFTSGMGMSARQVPHEIENLFDSLCFGNGVFNATIVKDVCRFANITDYWGMVTTPKKIILRSSSPLEDSQKTEYQFQGVFESDHMETTGIEEIYKSLRKIYLSPWSTYAEFYLRNRNLIGKVDRNLAVMVQEIPQDFQFYCRVFYKDGEVSIEYVSKDLYTDSQFVGLKVVVNNEGKIVKRENEVEDYFLKKDFGDQKMSYREVHKIEKVMRKLSKVSEYGNDFSTEVLAGGESPYIVQIRRTINANRPCVVPDINEIDRESVIVDFTAVGNNFSIGKTEGPVVNLMGYYKGHEWDDNGIHHHAYGDLNEYYEKARYYNEKFPGAIFIVSMDFGDQKILGEKFHILTSKKGGLITCYRYDGSRCPHFIAELYKDPCFHIVNVLPEPFMDIKTGTPIGVVSNGDKARFYHPKNYNGPTVVFSQPKISPRKNDIYHQDELFDSSKI